MKLTLVQPPSMMAVDSYSTITQPPLGIAYLAAYARRLGHEVHVVDGVGAAVKSVRPWLQRKKRLIQGLSFEQLIECIPRDSDVIGMSCMFTHAWPMVRELMLLLRKEFPAAKLIAGGEHVSAMYDTVLRRGCRFECTFCSSPQMWTQVWNARSPVKVVDEIEYYTKAFRADDFQFQDLTAIVRKDWIVAFCQELIRRQLNITWQLPV